MTAYHYLPLVTMVLVVIGCGARVCADDSVTIYHPPATPPASSSTSTVAAADAAAHKSLHHHRKKTTVADKKPGAAGAATATTTTPMPAAVRKTVMVTETKKPVPAPASTITISSPIPSGGSPVPASSISTSLPASPSAITVTKSPSDSRTQITVSAPALPPGERPRTPGAGPEVETGLPVARHDLGATTLTVGAAPIPSNATLPHANYQMASAFPLSPVVPIGSSAGSYLPGGHSHNLLDNYPFTNFDHRVKNPYPWKLNIITTIFWIGEGSTPISSTDNMASAWDQDWRNSNGGSDLPYGRNGYASGNHAAMINPFYIALPFNDLAFPEKAHRWLPAGWYVPPKDGKQVSACQHRWVEIKNAQGDVCYAQWEDVGPLRYDHAEYVFGDERPDTYSHAGLDISPAVAQYLNITGKNNITRWRFVDAPDVPPGYWLKYDEEALLFKAMKNLPPAQNIDVLRAPVDDQGDVDSNKKKVGSAKG